MIPVFCCFSGRKLVGPHVIEIYCEVFLEVLDSAVR